MPWRQGFRQMGILTIYPKYRPRKTISYLFYAYKEYYQCIRSLFHIS
jgi:hypothetical protein